MKKSKSSDEFGNFHDSKVVNLIELQCQTNSKSPDRKGGI